MPIMIRNADASDLSAIVDIYNAAIPGRLATADTEPVSPASRQSWFHDRDFSKHPIWVFEDPGPDKRIRGWLSFKPFYGRPAYSATAEVSIYVDPKVQRAGVATQLMEHAIERAPELRLTTYLAFVFAHNGPSLALCRKFGFEQWGRLPGIAVLDGTDRDLLILGRRIPLPKGEVGSRQRAG
jgi:L-amino acid N-acyltransferase YncA